MICAVALREGERLFWSFGILLLCTIPGVWQVGPGFFIFNFNKECTTLRRV